MKLPDFCGWFSLCYFTVIAPRRVLFTHTFTFLLFGSHLRLMLAPSPTTGGAPFWNCGVIIWTVKRPLASKDIVLPFNAVTESAIYEFGVYFCLIKVLYGEEAGTLE